MTPEELFRILYEEGIAFHEQPVPSDKIDNETIAIVPRGTGDLRLWPRDYRTEAELREKLRRIFKPTEEELAEVDEIIFGRKPKK